MYFKKIILAVSLIGILLLSVFTYYIYSAIFSPNTKFESSQVEVLVPTGATYLEVEKRLAPYVDNLNSFRQIASKKGYVQNPKAGRYILKKGMNNNDLVNTLRSKNEPIKVRFNNQEFLQDLAGRISGQIEADSISLLNAFMDKDFLKENNFTEKEAIGMYLPNTYEFFWNTSAEDFRDRMLQEYKKYWNKQRVQKAQKQGLTPKQVSVLASIVQKETAQVSERPRVAGVYLNRLRDGISLQADPTVIYAIKEHTGNYDTIIKRLLYKDLEINSPYNTYKYAGLPPSPIAMSDLSSIEAVLNPEKHDYYYFVADPSNFGYHKFARTLMQHNRNKQAYVRWLQRQGIHR